MLINLLWEDVTTTNKPQLYGVHNDPLSKTKFKRSKIVLYIP